MSHARHTAKLMPRAEWVQCVGLHSEDRHTSAGCQAGCLGTGCRKQQTRAIRLQLTARCHPKALLHCSKLMCSQEGPPSLVAAAWGISREGIKLYAARVPGSRTLLTCTLHCCSWSADYRRLVSPSRKSFAETYGGQRHATLCLCL